MSDSKLSRRDFFAAGTGAAAAGLLGTSGAGGAETESEGTSRVVLIRSDKVLGEDGQPDAEILHEMLNRAVAELLKEDDSAAAWKRLVSPTDVVGIKSNVWKYLATPPALEDAIRSEVVGAGVKSENVAVDDRGVLGNPVFKKATAYINTRPMRTHHWSGLGTSIKNMIMFVPRPQEYHADACAPLGSLWKLSEIEGKVRLNVLVMLTPQFHSVGAHSFSREFVWPYGGLIVGVDPVAVDATGERIIVAKRKLHFGDDRPMRPPAHHIQVADTQYGIGISDPERIDLVRVGTMEDALI